MNELDFDELDRAVSSLMNKATGKPEDAAAPQQVATVPQDQDASQAATPTDDSQPTTTPSEPVHEEEPAAEPQAQEEMQEPDAANEAEPAVDPTAQTDPQDEAKKKVIPHRTGRFMDMKTAPTAQPVQPPEATRMPSRVGVTLSPVVADAKPEATPAETEPEASEVTDAAQSDFPDPIDMMSAKSDEQAQATENVGEPESPETPELDKVEEEPDSTPETTSESESEKSNFSPFLADAKPEKRPLGTPLGSVEPSQESSPEANSSTDSTEKKDETVSDDAIDIPAPPEFDTALVALESGDVEKEITEPAKEEPEQVATPEQKDEPLPSPAAAETTPVKPTGPVSIQQQYDEQPSSGPGESGAIFDTASYHKPLDHPAKKSHGFMWVFLIIVVILLGAAVGVAFYRGYI